MKITLEVTPIDGQPYRVTTNLFSIIAMERKFGIKASDLASGIAMEHLAFLAFEGSKQQNIVVPVVFDDFVKNLENLEVVDTAAVNPTNEGRTSEG